MTNNKSEQFNIEQQDVASIAKVLSHPARIAIIQLLAKKKEIKTGNISDFLPISRSTVSQHLKELKDVGLIHGHVEGVKMNYCLDYQKVNEMKNLLGSFLDEFELLDDFPCK